MDDFLYALKYELAGKIPNDQIDYQLDLYRKYINRERNSGKSLDMVLRKLGDPAKIAELIVESYEQRDREEAIRKNMTESEALAAEINSKIQNPERGIQAKFIPDKGWDIRLGKLKLNSWYGTLIILGIVLAIFVLLSTIFPGIRMS